MTSVPAGRVRQMATVSRALGFDLPEDPTPLTTPVSSKRGDPEARTSIAKALTACPLSTCLLVDLGQNRGHLCDDPFLLMLTELLEAESSRFETVIVLLPFRLFSTDVTKPDYTSTERFQRTSCQRLIVVDSHLSGREFPKNTRISALESSDVTEQFRAVAQSPENELRDRLVRRLGHFRGSGNQCRSVSYAVHGADAALRHLLSERMQGVVASTVIYDARQNPWMRDAMVAYCTDRAVQQIAIDNLTTVLRSGTELSPPVVLLLDVVSSGDTARRILAEVASHLAAHSAVTVSAILGNRLTLTVDGKNTTVTPFVQVPVTSTPRDKCLQCKLNLPYQDEKAAEAAVTLREYDFWDLLTRDPWRPEVEPPIDVGAPYPLVPNYELVLDAAGDWLAYLTANRLRQVRGYWALVHPAQIESSALCRRIRAELQDLDVAIIAIPDDVISGVRTGNVDWRTVVDQSTQLWRTNLNLLRAAGGGAVAIDIFSGSGSTFKAMKSILERVDVPLHLVFPLIERNPEGAAQMGVAHDAAYTWWGPRKLNA